MWSLDLGSERREPREDPGEVWAAPDRQRPGRALGTGGAVACRAHSSGAGRPSLAFPPRCPASSAAGPPTPGATIAWELREEETQRRREKEREAAAGAQPAGARSAGGGALVWVAAGECARPAGELREGGPAPRAPRLASSRVQLAPLLHRHTPTERHRAPAAPAAAAAAPRAAGSRAKSRAGAARRAPLDFFFPLHSSPL